MLPYNTDKTIKFEHTPIIHKIGFQINQVGPDNPYEFPEVDYTDTDANTIYVNGTTAGDDSNPGTAASPKETLLAAINATTATKTKIIVQDTAIYNEDISGGTYTYMQGIYNETGQTSSWVGRLLGFVPSDSNAVFVAKTGSDTTGTAGTQADPWLTINAAILDCDTGRDVIVIMDSGTYEEIGFEFTGNFTGLYAAIGEVPTVSITHNPDYWNINNDISEKTILNGTSYGFGVISELPSGGLILFVRDGTPNLLYKVYDASHLEISSGTAVTGNYQSSACVTLANGNIFLLCNSGGNSFYVIIDGATYTVIKTLTALAITSGGNASVEELENGDVFILYRDSGATTVYYAIYNHSTDVFTKSETTIVTGGASSHDTFGCCRLLDGNMYIGYQKKASNFIYTVILNISTYAYDIAETILIGTAAWGKGAFRCIENGYVYAIWADLTPVVYYRIVDAADNSSFVVDTIIKNIGGGVAIQNLNIIQKYNANMAFYYESFSGGPVYLTYLKGYENLVYNIKVSAEAVINGVRLNASDKYWMEKYLYGNGAGINIIHCLLDELQSSTNNTDCIAISSDSHVDITNSIIHDCDIGVDTTESTSDFIDSQFFRINKGYAIDVTGAAGTGAGINFDHCDIFDCYGGIRLQSNDGGEEIKNCILHDCDVFAIFADTSITLDNTVYTNSLSGVAIGSSVVKANPLYINEGYIDPDDTDLNIRTKVLGYQTNSPTYGLADDDRNAGAIDVEYIGVETSYTSITVPKPISIKLENVYYNGRNVQRRDGSWSSYKEGESEVITMTWSGLEAVYVALLLILWKSSTYQVRIYPDPVTYPNSYEVYSLLREPFNNSVGVVTLSDLGTDTLTLKFAKAI